MVVAFPALFVGEGERERAAAPSPNRGSDGLPIRDGWFPSPDARSCHKGMVLEIEIKHAEPLCVSWRIFLADKKCAVQSYDKRCP